MKDLLHTGWAAFYRLLPGYPWLPCPICKGIEGRSDTVPERARAAGYNLHSSDASMKN